MHACDAGYLGMSSYGPPMHNDKCLITIEDSLKLVNTFNFPWLLLFFITLFYFSICHMVLKACNALFSEQIGRSNCFQ